MKTSHITLVVGVLFTFIVPAAEASRERNFFQASRALGMGDAYTAHNIGYEAVYYNPAGVAARNKPQLKLIDLEGHISSDSLGLFGQTLKSTAAMKNVVQTVIDNPGKNYAAGFNLLPQFLARNFSIGALLRFNAEAFVEPTTEDMDFFAFADIGAYAHYGVALWGGIVKLGIGVKLLNRAELNRVYDSGDITDPTNLDFSREWQEGVGFGYDAGMMVIVPIQHLPTFGLAVQDIGNTALTERSFLFSQEGGEAGAPPELRQKINLGYAMTFLHDRNSSSHLAFDLKDIAKMSDSVQDRMHFGYELNLNQLFFLRTGINQGRFWTAGLGLHLDGHGIEFTSYGERVRSTVPSMNRDERKWIGRYVLQF